MASGIYVHVDLLYNRVDLHVVEIHLVLIICSFVYPFIYSYISPSGYGSVLHSSTHLFNTPGIKSCAVV